MGSMAQEKIEVRRSEPVSCPKCGSIEMHYDPELEEHPVTCNKCGHVLGTLGEVKERVRNNAAMGIAMTKQRKHSWKHSKARAASRSNRSKHDHNKGTLPQMSQRTPRIGDTSAWRNGRMRGMCTRRIQ